MRFVYFVLIFLPLGFVVGLAAAIIAFTAWNVVVPLCFVALKFTIFDSIFTSMMVDVIDFGILSVFYAMDEEVRPKVHWKLGVGLGLYSAAVAVVVVCTVSEPFLHDHQKLLKGSVPYAVLVIAAGFVLRAYREQKAYEAAHAQGATGSTGPAESYSALPSGAHEPAVNFTSVVAGEEGEREEEEVEETGVGGWALLLVVVTVMSLVSGLLGFGGGTVYAVAIMITRRLDTVGATGTASVASCLLMLGTCSAYIVKGLVKFDEIWSHLLVAGGVCMVSVILGAKIAFKIDRPYVLSYVVAASIFLVCVASIAQNEALG